MRDVRRLVSTVVVASFSAAALLGILALLAGGDFGETEGRVLLTTVVVGLESVAMLCYLGLVGHRYVAVAYAGAPTSLATTALALAMTWEADPGGDAVWKAFGVLLTVAASLAQASLLLSLAGRDEVSGLLAATLAVVGVVAVWLVVGILAEGDVGSGFWRGFGVAAILDVLGTVVVTARGVFGDRTPKGGWLSESTRERVVEAARARGTTPDQLVGEALDAYLS